MEKTGKTTERMFIVFAKADFLRKIPRYSEGKKRDMFPEKKYNK